MQRCTAVVLSVALAGCSLGMKRVTSDYDPRTIPRCQTSAGPPLGDALAAVFLVGGGVALGVAGHPSDDGTSQWIPAAGAIVLGGIEALISKAGFGWDRECEQVKRDWDEMQIEQDSLVRRDAARRQLEEIKERDARTKKPAPAAAPRGFYCARSSAVSFCVRDKAECQRTRDVSLAAAADLTECTLTEKAWCTGEVCFPAADQCDARVAATGTGAACEERE